MTAFDAGTTPVWDLTDRMAKALKTADLSALAMAEYLDVNRGTVANWLHGKIRPSTQTLRLWAMRCGVPFEWLRDGDVGALQAQQLAEITARNPFLSTEFTGEMDGDDLIMRDGSRVSPEGLVRHQGLEPRTR